MFRWTIIAVALLTPPTLPSGGFRWERSIVPPAGHAGEAACVVLDAATFSNAAPSLRDLRLFQDGGELPYVVEESYDERALSSGVTPADDRSIYMTAAEGKLRSGEPATVPGKGQQQTWPSADGSADWQAAFPLAPHVPVERLRLDPVPSRPEHISIVAEAHGVLDAQGNFHDGGREQIEGDLDAAHPTLAITIGANLQREATITVAVHGSAEPLRYVVLEMRRRALCYQPRSVSPLTLYLGGGEGMAAKTYSLADSFSTVIDRPLATLGPLVPNQEKQPPAASTLNRLRWWLMAAALVCALLLVIRLVARRRRAAYRSASSTSR